LALYAVSVDRPVGIDVEWMNSDRIDPALISQLLAPEERAALSAMSPERRQDAFYACWTRKEAFLKATGDGLYYPLTEFAVSVDPAQPPRLIRLGTDGRAGERWSLAALAAGKGYAATLVAWGHELKIRQWEMRI
jgi:4'-phosphopantetheinyl transferase